MEQVLIHSLRKYGHALILLLFSCQAKLDGDITTQNPSDPALSPENIQTTTSKDTSETDDAPEIIVNNPETTNNTSNDPTPNSDPGPQVLALTLSDFSVSSVNYNSFDVSFNFLGDDNSNSTVQIYYCSVKQKFACDPKTDGVAGVLNKSSQKYNLVVDISAAPFSPGDVLKYEILATDADGLTGGQEYGEITIPFDISTPRSVGQLGYLDFGKDASNTEEVYTSTIDSFGNMYIAGHTKSHLNELNTSSQDAFIAKINNSGDVVWVSHLGMSTLGSAASGDEQVNDITLDSNGNIYIAGATSGSLGETNAGSSDGFVAKFDSNGKVIWIKQLGNITVGANASASDSLKAIAINSSEEIYVTGISLGNLGETNGGNSDIIAAKLDSGGNLIWLKQLGQTTLGVTAPSGFEDAHDIKIDSIGDVYITGETDGDLADTNGGLLYDIYIAKLTSAGNLVWIKQLGNTTPPGIDSSNLDYAYALALDSSDNIYVTGKTFGSLAETKSGGYDTYVIKFDSSGNLSWARQLGNTTIGANANAEDVGEDIAIDSTGNIFITGYTSSALGESSAGLIDIYLAKFNNAGTFQWVKQLGNTTIGSSGNNNDYSKSISIDSSGSLYIGGYTASSLGEASGGSSDAYAAKFDSTGTLSWLKQLGYSTIGGGSSSSEASKSIVLDASGNIYTAGETTGSLGEPSGGNKDIYITKYDSNRNLIWVKQLGATTIGTGANQFDFVSKIALDASNNIYITGHTLGALNGGVGGGSFDAYVAKFDNSGSLLWVTQLDPTSIGAGANNVEYSYNLVIDSSGNAYITGGTQGSLGETNGGFEDAYAAKIDTNGNVVWISQLGNTTMGAASSGSEAALGIAFDSNGDLILTGGTSGGLGETNAGSNDVFIAKLVKTTGAVSWVKQLGNTTIGAAANANDVGYDVALDSSDNIYVTGITAGALGETNGGSTDAFITKFDSSGTSLWIKQLGNTTMGANASATDYGNAIVLSNTGEIYITGETEGNLGEVNAGFRDSYVCKFDTSGNLVWLKQLGSVTSANAAGNDYSTDIAIGADLNFYITGETCSSYEVFNNSSTASNTSDGYFAVFDANGNLN